MNPQRTCLGCNAADGQSALLRIVIEDSGELKVDRLGTGRGGYLHQMESCWESFLRRKSLYRAFRQEVTRPVKEKLVLALRAGC